MDRDDVLKKQVTTYMTLFLALNTFTFLISAPIFYVTHTCGFSLVSFLISPVDGCEDFLLGYSSPLTGYIDNGVYVAVMIFAVASYMAFFMDGLRSYMSIAQVLVLGGLSTYIVSGLNWIFTGIPVLGTSLLGIGLLEFLAISLAIDFGTGVRDIVKKRADVDAYNVCRLCVMAFAAITSVYILNSFYIGNLYFGETVHDYHIEGLLAFVFMLLAWIAIKSWFLKRGRRISRKRTARVSSG